MGQARETFKPVVPKLCCRLTVSKSEDLGVFTDILILGLLPSELLTYKGWHLVLDSAFQNSDVQLDLGTDY